MLKRSRELCHKALFRCSRGDTLIELLVAMVVGAIVIVGLLSALGTAVLASHRVDLKTTARDLARSCMECVKAQPYGTDYEEACKELIKDNPPQGWTEEDVREDISIEFPDLYADRLQLVTVTVFYDNDRYEYELQGYKSNH